MSSSTADQGQRKSRILSILQTKSRHAELALLLALLLSCSSPTAPNDANDAELDATQHDVDDELDATPDDDERDLETELELFDFEFDTKDGDELEADDFMDGSDEQQQLDTTDQHDEELIEPTLCWVGSYQGVCEDPSGCPLGLSPAIGFCEDNACCFDAAGDPNIGQSCSVNALTGTCLPTTDCIGEHRASPGFCPGPSSIQCCTPSNASTSCDPLQHPQPNLGLAPAPGTGGCPEGMLRIDDFCVDRFEAALIELHDDQSSSPWSPFHNPGTRRVRAVSIEGAIPQGYISGAQAASACAEAGKRLCSDNEWLRACQGAQGWTFPYGNSRQPGLCNDARSPHPVVELFGSNEPWIWNELDNACINQLPESLARTGQHPQCVSQDGAFDLMGNLHEWTADPEGTFRGGFYVDTIVNGDGCLYRTGAHSFGYWDYSTGFRCCSTP
ncbi:MAG: SUMF1/EgtB/PvdO family nonheme iron enzyme [Myxococcota bacterium]|jgi:hypothetical protein|nr:SUMF1/EgtB/PvdO family nonheme iron enzyme [Myxococcota bacterium]